jgi:hypothetical protein
MSVSEAQEARDSYLGKNVAASLIIILLATFASTVLFSANIYLVVASLGLALSVFAFLNIKAAIWIIVLNVFLTSSMVGSYLPFIGRKAIWLTDLMLLVILVRLAVTFALEKTPILREKDNLLVCLLIAVGLISSIVNDLSATISICGFRNYFKYIPLFLAFKYLIDDRTFIKKVFLFWIVIALLNVPLSVYQFVLGEEIEVMSRYDLVGGVFSAGGSGILSLYQIVIIGYILLSYQAKPSTRRWCAVALILFLLLPVFINETKITFVLLPLAFAYVYRDRIARRPFETIGMGLLAVLLLFSLNRVYSRPDQDFGGQSLLSKDWLRSYFYDSSYFSEEESLNRLSAVEFAWTNISKDPVHFLIGVGPGNASYSALEGGVGKYYEKYSELNIDMVFLSKILWEYGVAGTALYFYLILYLWRSVSVVGKGTNDPALMPISRTFTLFTAFLLLTLIYNLSFYIDELACMFWGISGFFRQPNLRS